MVLGIGVATWIGRSIAAQQDPEDSARAVLVQYLQDGYSAAVTPSQLRGAQATLRNQVTQVETIMDPEKPSVFRSTFEYRRFQQCPNGLSGLVACSYDAFTEAQQVVIADYLERERRSAETSIGAALNRAVSCNITYSAGRFSGIVCELAPTPCTPFVTPIEPRKPLY